MIKGYCDKRFVQLKKILENQLTSNYELGASVAVEWKGKEVVNLFGGFTDDSKNKEWNENTLVNTFSVTKAIAGICILKLIDNDLLDVNQKVSYYWPEYGCNGKEETKVIDLLTHRAGMFGFQNDVPNASWNDWDVYVQALEQQEPFTEPGASQGYHAVTFAWLVGELFKKIDGRTIGEFFKTEIADPFNIDFHIGLNKEQINRCASISSFSRLDSLKPPVGFLKYTPNFLLNSDLYHLKNSFKSRDFLKAFMTDSFLNSGPNTIDFRTAELPSGNGHGTASGLAKLFGILSSGGTRDEKQITKRSTLNDAIKICSSGPDTVLFGIKLNFGYCFMLEGNKKTNMNYAPIFYENTFGHSGIGGSVAFGDIKNQLGYSFVCNKQQKPYRLYKTSNMLTKALYDSIN